MKNMKKILGYIVFALEVLVCAAALIIGLFKIKVSFMEDTRMVVVVLGAVGMLFCVVGVVRFIKRAPGHILSIIGYLLGVIAMGIFFIQLFKLDVPFLGDPYWALACMCAVIVIKGVIGRNCPENKAKTQSTTN